MRKQLSGKEIKELLEILPESLQVFSKKDKVELFNDIYKLNEKPFIIVLNEKILKEKKEIIIPHLKFLMTTDISKFKCITVDMGAIKFVVGGADIMRPGITHIDDGFAKDEYIVIIDVNNKKPLAIGLAMYGSEEMKQLTSGKVIKNIHFIGDEFWKFV